MKKQLRKFFIPFLGVLLITAGVLSFIFSKNLTNLAPEAASAAPIVNTSNSSEASVTVPVTGEGLPVKIEVPDANINVPVAKGYYNSQTKTWTLSKTNAHFAMITTKPNSEGGLTFIYGHRLSTVFARLPRVHKGSVVMLTTDQNKRYFYKMSHSFTKSPTDSAFLNYNGAPILMLQTCSGFNDQNRTLYVFDLVGVTNV